MVLVKVFSEDRCYCEIRLFNFIRGYLDIGTSEKRCAMPSGTILFLLAGTGLTALTRAAESRINC